MLYFNFNAIVVLVWDIQKFQSVQDMKRGRKDKLLAILSLYFRPNVTYMPYYFGVICKLFFNIKCDQ